MSHLSSGDPCLSNDVALCLCVCVYCKVLTVAKGSLPSRCPIFRWPPVKMSHLSSGDPCLSNDVALCLCVCVRVCVCVCACVYCKVLTVAKGSLPSRCPIFRWLPVKMSHLSSGDPCLSNDVALCLSVYVRVCTVLKC